MGSLPGWARHRHHRPISEADAVAQNLFDHATQDAPGSVDANISQRLARKLSSDPWVDDAREDEDQSADAR
jgi:hypothetical protein